MPEIVYVQPNDSVRRTIAAEDGESVMEAALRNDVPGIVADCGGAMSCATCHVYIDEAWLDATGRASEDEEVMLEMAIDPRGNSRLSCQVKMSDALDGLVVHVPRSQF